jgi:osmoprotectant transport system ATP-binding protein
MIDAQGLSKSYSGRDVVADVSLNVVRGQIAVLVGRSGSGKTTLLRMFNRLVVPDSGRIWLDGQDTSALPSHILRRRIGYAIQGNGLFPHWTVARNIATVPKLLGWSRAQIAARVDELLHLFDLDPATFRDRLPYSLSGGQAQRVGVARALAARPDLVLMDEPFGALDPLVRARAQDDLRAIQRQLGTTIVIVTHDMDEAIRLGDRIGVMEDGRLLQYGPPDSLLTAPATPHVADLIGLADRPFRLLALTPAHALREDGTAEGAPLPETATQRDALARCLWEGRETLPLAGGGIVTRAALMAQARGGA